MGTEKHECDFCFGCGMAIQPDGPSSYLCHTCFLEDETAFRDRIGDQLGKPGFFGYSSRSASSIPGCISVKMIVCSVELEAYKVNALGRCISRKAMNQEVDWNTTEKLARSALWRKVMLETSSLGGNAVVNFAIDHVEMGRSQDLKTHLAAVGQVAKIDHQFFNSAFEARFTANARRL